MKSGYNVVTFDMKFIFFNVLLKNNSNKTSYDHQNINNSYNLIP